MGELFSDRLAKAIRDSGKKQSEIAAAVGITAPYLSDLKKGKKASPSPHVARALAESLNVSLGWLLADSEFNNADCDEDSKMQRHAAESFKRWQSLSMEGPQARLALALKEIEVRLQNMPTVAPKMVDTLAEECQTRVVEFSKWAKEFYQDWPKPQNPGNCPPAT